MYVIRKEIAPGSKVTLHLSLHLLDGTEALSTFGDDPMTLVMGDGTLPEGLELALYGLRKDAEQTLQLTPEQAFGFPDDATIHPVPRTEFPPAIDPKPGQLIHFSSPDGDETVGTVLELSQHQVMVDFNHPLAGHPVVFKALILAVE